MDVNNQEAVVTTHMGCILRSSHVRHEGDTFNALWLLCRLSVDSRFESGQKGVRKADC